MKLQQRRLILKEERRVDKEGHLDLRGHGPRHRIRKGLLPHPQHSVQAPSCGPLGQKAGRLPQGESELQARVRIYTRMVPVHIGE